VVDHYGENDPLFAVIMIQAMDGIGGGYLPTIIANTAARDLDLGVKLTLRFGNGKKFRDAVGHLLFGSLKADGKDVPAQIDRIRKFYGDPDDYGPWRNIRRRRPPSSWR
jgi:hypothetical protein